MKTFEKVYSIVSKIPKGKVLTYGRISQITGTDPRVVGYALHANKNPDVIPCHRVVHKDGSLAGGYAFGGKDVQKKLLTNERVNFIGDRVNLETNLFKT